MSRYPYIDRNPCIVAVILGDKMARTIAGKPIGDPCANAKELFQNISLEEKIDVIRKQFGLIEAKDYGPEWIKAPIKDASGAFTEIRHCMQPNLISPFQSMDEEIKSTIYNSYWNKPLGKSRDQTPGLPAGMIPDKVTFGKPRQSFLTSGELINPRIDPKKITEEERLYHDMYAFSHQNHYPGEQVKIGYEKPFDSNKVYGKPSNKDERGLRLKECLTWFNNDPLSHVSRRQANVRNRTLPFLGKVIDKTGVTKMVPPNHTYGKPSSGDFYGVEDLLNECTPSLVRRDMLTFLSYANKLRLSIYSKIRTDDLNLEELYEEIMSLNENEENPDCSVNFDCIDAIMKKRGIFLDKNKLQPLLLALKILSEDGRIKVRDFLNFIDKNGRFPDIERELFLMPPEYQNYDRKYRSEFENPEDLNRIVSMPPAGMPNVRLDKPYPIYTDSIIYMNDLSQETTARTLISPSIYTQYGLSHRDFFQPRSKEFLGKLFKKINVDLTEEELDDIYKEGYELDKTGGVCVETFRNILDDRVYKAYNRLT